MPHLVPNPPSADYWCPLKVPRFSILTSSGTAMIRAWGIDPQGTYKVNLSPMDPRVSGDKYPGFDPVYGDLAVFYVRGLIRGDNVAIYQDISKDINNPNWIMVSDTLQVDEISSEFWQLFTDGNNLPQYMKVPNIRLYPFGSLQIVPQLREGVWMQSVFDVLDRIYANSLGRTILNLVPANTIIYPLFSPARNAYTSTKNGYSSILFSPQDFVGAFEPGHQADEILLHELIHVIEKQFGGYQDVEGADFIFGNSDFTTINATNVYSCLLGRGLRRDHNGFNPLADKYFDPKLHFDLFVSNYNLANQNSPQLCNVLKYSSNLWNPYKFI